MSLADDLKKIKEEAEPQVTDLRKALLNAQKQLAKIKDRDQQLGELVLQAAYDATLSMGAIPPVPKPNLTKAKAKACLLYTSDAADE